MSYLKTFFFINTLWLSLAFVTVQAQHSPGLDSLQYEWLSQASVGDDLTEWKWAGGYMNFMRVSSSEPEVIKALFALDDPEAMSRYVHEKTFRHDDGRYLTVGSFTYINEQAWIITGWRESPDGWKKEIDVILNESGDPVAEERKTEILNLLTDQRREWERLANQHNPETHIEESYFEDAIYFSNGDRSEGRQEIIDRYSYMENPNYQVHLQQEWSKVLSDKEVLEIGRYFTGPEKRGTGGLYLILWRQTEETPSDWKIKLDFNF